MSEIPLQKDPLKNSTNAGKTANTTSSMTTGFDTQGVSQDSKNMALILWLGCLFLGIFMPIIMMFVQKDDAYLQTQAKEALNMNISMFLGYIGLGVLAFILGVIFAPLALLPLMFMGVLGLAYLAFCILGAVKCSAGNSFKVPFILRLIQ